MNVESHRREIEQLYTDRVTVYRYEKDKNPVTKETELKPQLVYTDQPCRLSQRDLGSNQQTEAENVVSYETKLFIAPELEIRQGYLLEVTRGTVTRKYTAGEPFVYPTHQEISVQRKDWA